MSRGKHTEAEIIAALKQVEAGQKAEDLARKTKNACAVQTSRWLAAQGRVAHPFAFFGNYIDDYLPRKINDLRG
jgi:hypothetical protein